MDPSLLPELTAKGVAAALLWKVMGPPASAVGDKLKTSVENFRLSNFGRILEVAAAKLGPTVDEEGAVPLRVSAETWDRGTYSSDELSAEYFGGILASSRSPDGTNDRGVAWATLVGSLATDDLRLHFLLYRRWRELLQPFHDDEEFNLGEHSIRTSRCALYVPHSELRSAFGSDAAWGRTLDATQALHRTGLIEDEPWGMGPVQGMIERLTPGAPEPGLVVCPSDHGIKLFCWAHALPGYDINVLRSPDIEFETVADLPVFGDGARLCSDIPRPVPDGTPAPVPEGG